MKKTKTFSNHILSQTIWLSIALFIAFLLILFTLSIQITDLTISSLSNLEAKNMTHNESFPLYKKWENIPSKYRKVFHKKDAKINVTLEHYLEEQKKIVYLYSYLNEGKKINYILSVYNKDAIEEISNDIFVTNIVTIAVTTMFIFGVLFFILKWLIYKTAQPYNNLSYWVRSIQKDSDDISKIDFAVEEVNHIAFELEKKIITIKKYAKREKEFLKYTSHELRTPLSIIQASLDTINESNSNPNRQKTLNRALKASNNIKIISSALLYLARESSQVIKKSRIKVKPFIQNIINDHIHLLKNKDININFSPLTETVLLEEEFFFIIVSNLIKNAFQHTQEGSIDIIFTDEKFTITNAVSNIHSIDNKQQIGFSLGLKLVELICQKLSYTFKVQDEKETFLISINW